MDAVLGAVAKRGGPFPVAQPRNMLCFLLTPWTGHVDDLLAELEEDMTWR